MQTTKDRVCDCGHLKSEHLQGFCEADECDCEKFEDVGGYEEE